MSREVLREEIQRDLVPSERSVTVFQYKSEKPVDIRAGIGTRILFAAINSRMTDVVFSARTPGLKSKEMRTSVRHAVRHLDPPISSTEVRNLRLASHSYKFSFKDALFDSRHTQRSRNAVVLWLRRSRTLSESATAEIFLNHYNGHNLSRQRINQIVRDFGDHTERIRSPYHKSTVIWHSKLESYMKRRKTQFITKIAKDKIYWGARGLIRKKLLEEIGIASNSREANNQRYRFMIEKYRIPDNKTEFMFHGLYPSKRSFKHWFNDLYYMQGKSLAQIAEILRLTQTTLDRQLKKMDIPRRRPGPKSFHQRENKLTI